MASPIGRKRVVSTPRPRPLSSRGRRVLLVILALVAVLYILVVTFYNAEGSNRVTGGIGPTSEAGLLITVEPIAVNPVTGQATVDLSMGWQGGDMVDADGHLRENTRVTINSSVGTQEAKFIAGDSLGRLETIMGVDGEQSNYPFDVHTGSLTFTADTCTTSTDGSIQSTGPLATGLESTGGVSGWDTTSRLGEGLSEFQGMDLTFDGAFSTQVFALPLLRNYFPNGPPVGASIDIFVYLWVIVMAVIAATLNVIAWMNQTRDSLNAAGAHVEASHSNEQNPELHHGA